MSLVPLCLWRVVVPVGTMTEHWARMVLGVSEGTWEGEKDKKARRGIVEAAFHGRVESVVSEVSGVAATDAAPTVLARCAILNSAVVALTTYGIVYDKPSIMQRLRSAEKGARTAEADKADNLKADKAPVDIPPPAFGGHRAQNKRKTRKTKT